MFCYDVCYNISTSKICKFSSVPKVFHGNHFYMMFNISSFNNKNIPYDLVIWRITEWYCVTSLTIYTILFILYWRFGMLGSIDSNTGSPDLGWDTDQFPMDVKNATMVMKVLKIIWWNRDCLYRMTIIWWMFI